MGIDYDGGMLVGARRSKLNDVPDELWYEDGMAVYAERYDGEGHGYCHIGFEIDNIPVSQINEEWLNNIRTLAEKFKEITGVEAELIGCQNIW